MCRYFLNNEKKRDESEKNANFSWNHYNWMIPTCWEHKRECSLFAAHILYSWNEKEKLKKKEKKRKKIQMKLKHTIFFSSLRFENKNQLAARWPEIWFQFSLANFSRMNCKCSSLSVTNNSLWLYLSVNDVIAIRTREKKR